MKIIRINKLSSGTSRRPYSLFQAVTNDYQAFTLIAKNKSQAFRQANKVVEEMNENQIWQ